MHRKLSDQACGKPQRAATNYPEKLLPALEAYFDKFGFDFGKDKATKERMIEVKLDAAIKIFPPSYCHFRDGNFKYHPTQIVIKYSETWVSQKLRLFFNVVKVDTKGQIINTC